MSPLRDAAFDPQNDAIWPGLTRRQARWGLVILALAAIGLRLILIWQESYWMDELLSWKAASGRVFKFVWERESNPPLFFLLLKLWGKLFGDKPIPMRVYSAVMGGLCAPAVWMCARRWRVGAWPARAVTLLAALHPMAYWFSQQNRYYATLQLAGILWLATLPAVLWPERKRLICWPFAIAGFLCFFTHYYFAFYAIASGAGLLAWWAAARRDKASLWRILANYLVMGGLMLLLLPLFLHQRHNSSPIVWAPRPEWRDFLIVFSRYYWIGPRVDWTAWHAPAIALLALASAAGYARQLANSLRGRASNKQNRLLGAGVLLGGLAVCPVFLAFMVSRLLAPIFVAERYTFLFLPSFLLCLVIGWSLWPGKAALKMLGGAIALTSAMFLYSIATYWTGYQVFDWTGSIKLIRQNWHEGDAIVFSPYWLKEIYKVNGGYRPKEENKKHPKQEIDSRDFSAIQKAPRVWLYVWEQAPALDGTPDMQRFRAQRRYQKLLDIESQTLGLMEPQARAEKPAGPAKP